MKTLINSFVLCVLFFTHTYAQVGTPAPQTFVFRTDSTVEKILVSQNNIGEILELSYQGTKDKNLVKLEILKIDNEKMRLTAQNPNTKETFTFDSSFIMAAIMFLPGGSTKEFMREIICKASTGEQLITSGAPMFLPYFYAPNANTPFKELIVSQEQINNTKKLSTGEDYYEVSLPNKKGKFKIINMPYDSTNNTKIKLITPTNKSIIFKGK